MSFGFHAFAAIVRLPARWLGAPARWAGLTRAEYQGPDPAVVRNSLDRIDPFSAPPVEDDKESPVFVLATGWRTGSTLVQRLLLTDPDALLWGEPVGRAGILERLTIALSIFTDRWPMPEFWIDRAVKRPDLSISQVANLYPPGRSLRLALRSFLLEWMAAPARAAGYRRWGFKEVRLGAAEACLLHWLFPRAVFVVVTRHPADAWLSLKAMARLNRRRPPMDREYRRFPDLPLNGVLDYARHWNRLATSWAHGQHLPHCILRYEDVVAGCADLAAVAKLTGLRPTPEAALAVRPRGSRDKPAPSWLDNWTISRAAADGMKLLGYHRRGTHPRPAAASAESPTCPTSSPTAPSSAPATD